MIAAALLAASVGAAAQPSSGFKRRGVLEGFYGTPWTWEQRRRLVDWLPAHHFNLYAIAPKDDPELRARWRDALSPETRRELKVLRERAQARGVTLAWTLSPGLDVVVKDPRDVSAAVDKFVSVCELGIKSFSLAFDDTPADPGQVRFADEVRSRVAKRCPGAEMTFVPAQYWGAAAPSRYLSEVARKLDPAFTVGWTGPGIVNRSIAPQDSTRFRDFIRHDLVLGDNYPVQDRLADSGRLFLGPPTGRGAALAGTNVGYLANGSPLFEASLIPLAAAGDYAWDPARYDAAASWKKAVAEAGGPRGQKTLALLAGLCARSWLEPPPNETDALEAAISIFWKTGNSETLRGMLADEVRLKDGLRTLPPALAVEVAPWAEESSDEARGALDALEGRSPAFVAGRAVVADQALERLTAGLAARRRETAEPLARLLARGDASDETRAGLDRLIEDGRAAGPSPELVPWTAVLAQSALLTRAALDGKTSSGARLQWLRWKARAAFLPLLVSRLLLERFLSRKEFQWGIAPPPRPAIWWEKAWLYCERIDQPDSFPARLSAALDDDARMGVLLAELKTVAGAWKGKGACVEQSPWLDKLTAYAELGARALEISRRRPTLRELLAWERDREKLRSGNGLELVVELKLQLDAAARGEKGPASFPSDPAGAL